METVRIIHKDSLACFDVRAVTLLMELEKWKSTYFAYFH